jgi:hypothetical protein
MNITLWVLQVLLALYYAMGGMYQLNVGKLPPAWFKIVPKPGWIALGGLQVLFALGLVLPPLLKAMPQLTPGSAVGLIVETLVVYSLTIHKFIFKAFVWVLVPAVLAAFVAYGRFVLAPF